MKFIKLTQGFFAMIDDEDFERVNSINWFAKPGHKTFYAMAGIIKNGKHTTILLHTFILGGKFLKVDHKDGNGLNCQKQNLRYAERHQNQRNRSVNSNSASGLKGVKFSRRRNDFQARISYWGLRIGLGYYKSPGEAAAAYDAAADHLYGEFARTNKSMGLLTCH